MTANEIEASLKARLFFKLTPSQWRLFSILVTREQLSLKQIFEVLWPNPDNEPNRPENTIRAHMYRTRRLLKEHSIDIKLVWGRGYFMTKAEQKKAIELIKKAMEE